MVCMRIAKPQVWPFLRDEDLSPADLERRRNAAWTLRVACLLTLPGYLVWEIERLLAWLF